MNQLINGDSNEELRNLEDNSVDAVITDPPYGYSFMGKDWDKAVPSMELWAQCLRALKPGGYLLSFGSTRTSHRIAVNIEDAGFEIRDTIMWLYGSGFPKSRFMLKPACEPIVVARKPGPLRLNIEGSRINYASDSDFKLATSERPNGKEYDITRNTYSILPGQTSRGSKDGRWPANVVMDEVAAAVLDNQSGYSKTNGIKSFGKAPPTKNAYGQYAKRTEDWIGVADEGGASRFFYVAKAAASERKDNNHPTVKPLKLMSHLIRLYTNEGDVILDPFAGSGTTIVAAQTLRRGYIGIEREAEYVDLARKRIEQISKQSALL